MSQEDILLYEKWAAGERAAGQRLIQQSVASVARFFGNKVAHFDDRPDLVAKTFEVVLRKLGDYRGDSTFRAYVLGIARNVLRDYLKALRRRPTVTPIEDASLVELTRSPTARVAEAQGRQLLLVALRAIPLHAQIVLELSLFEELGRAEIADILGVPEGTIASRIRRGRVALDQQLAGLASGQTELSSTLDSLDAWHRRMKDALEHDP